MITEERGRATQSIVQAFETVDVVCIGDVHQLQNLGDFLALLLREPGFAEACNDIVVECGNSRYQETADRFIAGEDVPPADLLRIWRDTTQPAAWDSPLYGQFLVRVREANRALPPERRLRVLLGDAPIDWDKVRTPADFAPFAAVREPHFAAILEAQVLRKGRKALFWAGASHVVRRPENIPNPVVLIEKRGTGRTFVVLTHSRLKTISWKRGWRHGPRRPCCAWRAPGWGNSKPPRTSRAPRACPAPTPTRAYDWNRPRTPTFTSALPLN